MQSTVLYHERLWPAAWLFISTALVIPASLLVFLPIDVTVGIVVAIVLYLGCVGLLLATSPTLEVTEISLVAGRARLPIGLVGPVAAFAGEEATLERGQRLDARAYLVIRGWIDPVIRIDVDDALDPAPYWLLSTRTPSALADALTEARRLGSARDSAA